jgi:hypothetical protein
MNGAIDGYVVADATVDYQPDIKYRIEKKNAFDPTIIIKREPYHDDVIECQAILLPSEYETLSSKLTSADKLYIEFDSGNKTLQFPVTVEKLPKLEDDSRSFKSKIKFTLNSIYKQLNYIDFDNVFGYGNDWGDNWGF